MSVLVFKLLPVQVIPEDDGIVLIFAVMRDFFCHDVVMLYLCLIV